MLKEKRASHPKAGRTPDNDSCRTKWTDFEEGRTSFCTESEKELNKNGEVHVYQQRGGTWRYLLMSIWAHFGILFQRESSWTPAGASVLEDWKRFHLERCERNLENYHLWTSDECQRRTAEINKMIRVSQTVKIPDYNRKSRCCLVHGDGRKLNWQVREKKNNTVARESTEDKKSIS